MHSVIGFLPRLVDATLLTLFMFVTVAFFSLTLGLLFALLLRFAAPDLNWPLRIYSAVFRGIPELIVLFACYFVLPQLGITLSPTVSAILGFSLVRTAYDLELFKGVLNSIDPTQLEASRALGMPLPSVIRRILIPQLLRIAAGPWITQSVGSLKSLSLASAIAVPEIMQVTRQGIVATGKPFEFILTSALIYCAISSIFMVLEVVIDMRSNYLRSEASQ